MKHWFAYFIILTLSIGLILTSSSHASAQTERLIRVVKLSPSGNERAHALAFSQNGNMLAVGGTSGIYLFDTQKLSNPDFIQTRVWARSLLFLPQTNTLAAGLFDNTIKFWEPASLQQIKAFEDPDGWVRSISISRDGSLLASASDDDKIRIWRTDTDNLSLVLNDLIGVRVVALSPDGSLVAGALSDNSVRVWRVSNGELLYALAGHTDWARCLDFSPDGSLLASGGFDNTVRLWNMADGNLQQILKGHTSSVLGLDFSPDGQTLASGAIDQTILLWNVSDGRMMHTLMGHTDFVYAVAFSPDGKTIASGGGDNTLRVWNLEALDDTPPDSPHPVSSDCRQCHHRRGQYEPARVIDLSCEACHAGGIGLSWCPAFPRSASAGQTPIQYHATYDVSGVPVNDQDVAIILASPGNGETFYTMYDLMSPEIISGRVYYKDHNAVTAVNVQLEIVSNGQVAAVLETFPTGNGEFNFNVAINPESPPSYSSKPATRQCVICHDDSIVEAGLPVGTVHFRVTATAPDGARAFDERWARIDSSRNATVPLQVVDEETRIPLANLLVEASTILYEWRERYGSGTTDASGNIQLKLEQLSQAATVYEISIPPQILNGMLYTSTQPVTITLDPNESTHPTVLLTARAQKGQINGGFAPSAALDHTSIWAVHLPGGPIHKTGLAQGMFVFEDIPVGRYVLAPDSFALAEQNLYTSALSMDLFTATDKAASFSLHEGASISGHIVTKDGGFLPFAWINAGNSRYIRASDPVSGKYIFPVPGFETSFATASAPGYYAYSQSVTSLNENAGFQLNPRPETQFIQWGNGQIVLPPETRAVVNGSDFNLEYGWMWGVSSASLHAILINSAGMQIRMTNGQFALEAAADGTGWLYVYQGEATITDAGNQDPIQVKSGEMIALVRGANPFPMESAVAMALHPPLADPPIFEIVEPAFGAKLQNWLVQAGIGVMQIITFITYILSLVTLITILFHRLFLKKKKWPPTEEN